MWLDLATKDVAPVQPTPDQEPGKQKAQDATDENRELEGDREAGVRKRGIARDLGCRDAGRVPIDGVGSGFLWIRAAHRREQATEEAAGR